jgi:dynein heavy chain
MGPDDMEEIAAALQPAMAAAGLAVNKMTVNTFFVQRCAVFGHSHAACMMPAALCSRCLRCACLRPRGCRVRASLHLVLCFSPMGDAFRQRLRMFPSLVNCTTIDWFANWPVEALTGVAKSFCADLQLGSQSSCGCAAEAAARDAVLMEGVLAACVHIHQSVEAKSRSYYEELRRCATPA